jgi:diamine N-acetyltransferase
VLPGDVALTPVIEPDFQELRQLADRIWRQHYTGMISTAQIDHMLDCRFSDDALRTYLQTATSWLELLRVAGSAVGYCGYAVVAEDPQSLKLGQLYLLDSHRGMGLGRFMLSHMERHAENLGLHTIVLQVNKRNEAALAFYKAAGFTIRHAAIFEIGGGFVMDDYVMERRRSPQNAGKMRKAGDPRGLRRDPNDWETYSDSPDRSDNNDE